MVLTDMFYWKFGIFGIYLVCLHVSQANLHHPLRSTSQRDRNIESPHLKIPQIETLELRERRLQKRGYDITEKSPELYATLGNWPHNDMSIDNVIEIRKRLRLGHHEFTPIQHQSPTTDDASAFDRTSSERRDSNEHGSDFTSKIPVHLHAEATDPSSSENRESHEMMLNQNSDIHLHKPIELSPSDSRRVTDDASALDRTLSEKRDSNERGSDFSSKVPVHLNAQATDPSSSENRESNEMILGQSSDILLHKPIDSSPSDSQRIAYAKRLIESFVQFKGRSFDISSIAEAYFRAEVREGVQERDLIPAQLFGSDIQRTDSLLPVLPRGLKKSNIIMMSLYPPEDFEILVSKWESKYFSDHGFYFEDPQTGTRENFVREMYSEPGLDDEMRAKIAHFDMIMEREFLRQARPSPRMMKEIGKVIKYWTLDGSFTELESLRCLDKLDRLKNEDTYGYEFAEKWLERNLLPDGHLRKKFKQLHDLEKSIFEKKLHIILNSVDIKPSGEIDEKSYQVAMELGFEGQKTWNEICNSEQYARLKGRLITALGQMNLLSPPGEEFSLINMDLLDEATRLQTGVRVKRVIQRNDLDPGDRALFTWSALNDPSLSNEKIRRIIEKGKRGYQNLDTMIQAGESIRLRIQSALILIFPWAYERYHALPTNEDETAFSLAASAFLMMRKWLEQVLGFTPDQLAKFKNEVIGFLGPQIYDKRLDQILRISDELRQVIKMRKMRSSLEKEDLIKTKDWFDYRLELEKFRKRNPDGFEQLNGLFESILNRQDKSENLISMEEFYHQLSTRASAYYLYMMNSSLNVDPTADITEEDVEMFKAIEEINREIPPDERLEALHILEKQFPEDFNALRMYEEAQVYRSKATENYQALLRWKEKYDTFGQIMSKEFHGWLRRINDNIIYTDEESFTRRRIGKRGHAMIRRMVSFAPPRFRLAELVEHTLGNQFFINREMLMAYGKYRRAADAEATKLVEEG